MELPGQRNYPDVVDGALLRWHWINGDSRCPLHKCRKSDKYDVIIQQPKKN